MSTCWSGIRVQVEVRFGLAVQEELEESDIFVPDGSLTVCRLYLDIEQPARQLQPISTVIKRETCLLRCYFKRYFQRL